MTAEELISQLKTIVNNDTAFCERAENMQWIDVSEEWLESWLPFKNIDAEILHFPKGYVEENFLDAYVRCELSLLARLENWGKDFWKEENMNKEGSTRKDILKSAEVRKFYADYNTIEDIRLNAGGNAARKTHTDFLDKVILLPASKTIRKENLSNRQRRTKIAHLLFGLGDFTACVKICP